MKHKEPQLHLSLVKSRHSFSLHGNVQAPLGTAAWIAVYEAHALALLEERALRRLYSYRYTNGAVHAV